MSTTTTLQSAGQDIPLQLLGQPLDSFQHENDEARGNDERYLPARHAPQNPSSNESEQPENTNQRGTLPNSPANADKAEGWPIRLNAMQVLLGMVSLVGFFVMLYPQIISLKLAQWTAEKDFRDECRTLMSEIHDIGEDCKHILHQPFPKPPIYAHLFRPPTHQDAHTNSYESNNLTLSPRGLYHSPYSLIDQRGHRTTYNSLMLPAILISTIFIFTAATCWRHVRRPTHTLCNTWVASHIPRVETKAFYESTTIQVFVKDVASLRRRLKIFHILTKPMQFGSESRRLLESTNITDHREQSSQTSVTSEWASGWEDVSDSVTTDDGGDECMGAWLPVATGMEDDSTCQQQDSTVIKYHATLELVIDKLYAIGYKRFAFKHLKSGHSPFSHVAAVRQQPHIQDYSICNESTSWLENLSTTCTIFPEALVRHLKNHSRESKGAWLMKIPGFATDAAFVSLIHSRMGRCYWQFLKPGDSVDEQSCQSDAPCLWVASITRHRALLLFTNITLSEYYSLTSIVQVKDQIEPFPWQQQEESNFADETSSTSFCQNGLLQTRQSEQLFQWHDQGVLDFKADNHLLNDSCHMVGHFVEGPTSNELVQVAEESRGATQGWSEERVSTAHSSVKLDLSSKRLTSLDAQVGYRSQLPRISNATRRSPGRHVDKASNSMIRADWPSTYKMRTWEDFRWQELHPPAHDTMLTTSRHATALTQPRDELQHLGHNTSSCLPQAISTVEPYVYDQWSKSEDSVESGESRVTEEQPYSSAQLSRDIVTAEKVQRRLWSSSKSLRKRLGFKRETVSSD